MTYQFHTDCNQIDFDAFVLNSDQNNLFQSSDWAKIKTNWTPYFTSATEDGKIVAAALVLIRPLILGKTLAYIPRGPIMDYHDPELVSFMIHSLTQFSKEHKAAALRFDPAIKVRKYPYGERNALKDRENLGVISELESLGCKHNGFTINIDEATQPRFNAEMDVTADYRDHLEHKTVKCINASEHKGIEVLEGPEYVHDLAKVMHYTEIRKKVALRSEDYFKQMLEVYGDHGICMVTVLNFKEQIEKLENCIQEYTEKLNGTLSKKERNITKQNLDRDTKELAKLKEDQAREGTDSVITCGILAAYNKGLMELYYMGNHPDYLRMYSSYLLYSKCLDRCVELGIKQCSFGGIEGTLDDGLTLFKSNWIMNVEEYIGEFNAVIDPLIYHAFDRVYPWVLAKAAKLRGKE